MQKYILNLALFCLLVESRRQRTWIELEDDPEGIDLDDIVLRKDKPSGFEASDDAVDEERQFLRWMFTNSKAYKTFPEMDKRKNNWLSINKMIRDNNRASETSRNPNAPFMDHNKYSDLDEDERDKMLGLMYSANDQDSSEFIDQNQDQDQDQGHNSDQDQDATDSEESSEEQNHNSESSNPWKRSRNGRNLSAVDDKPILFDQSIVGPVLDQGRCGSCYAFSALTPLEGTMVIRQREQQAAEGITDPSQLAQWRQLSKQHVVDCTFANSPQDLQADFNFKPEYVRNMGCGGGRMDWTWDFLWKYGARWDDQQRPYDSGNTLLEGDCQHWKSKSAIKVKNYIRVLPDPVAIKRELKQKPLSIGIGAGSKLYSYKSGVIAAGDESWCTDRLNHAVTLVGYTPGAAETSETTTEYVPQCRKKFKKDANGCRKAGEYEHQSKYCCKDVRRKVTSSSGTWLVQNSWGSDWGEDGYVEVEYDSTGRGFCGMHQDVHKVEPNMKKFQP